jgi:hypothetical protein
MPATLIPPARGQGRAGIAAGTRMQSWMFNLRGSCNDMDWNSGQKAKNPSKRRVFR